MKVDELNYRLVNPAYLKSILYEPEIESTNEYAVRLSLPADSLVITSNQTKGKGRFSREWVSSPGKNIAMTLVKKFRLTVDMIHNVSFYSSLTLHKILKNRFADHNIELRLKWPNDLLLNGKKVAGFLLDSKDLAYKEKKIFIGVGVNVNEAAFDDKLSRKATSLFLETGTESKPEEIISDFVKSFYDGIELVYDSGSLMDQWKENCEHIGKTVNFKLLSDGEIKPALVRNIANDGSLLLKFDDGTEKSFYSGEISFDTSVQGLHAES